MPSLKAIRTRIASVKNTQKITRAMKLVAAARLRRAQDAIVAQRPYARHLGDIVADLTARISEGANGEPAHPLLARRHVRKLRLVVVTSDRGLAGGFNSNLLRRVDRFLFDEGSSYESIALTTLGRKGREHCKRRKHNVTQELPGPSADTVAKTAHDLAVSLSEEFLSGEVDSVQLVFNHFKSAISQVVTMDTLLPLKESTLPEGAGRIDFEYEPSREEMLTALLPLYLETALLNALLESIASEFGARMSAMDSATKNAKEMIGSLTLEYNRARQAAITKELMEIVGGAEALKG